jgi:hypothetical protein
MATQQPSEPSMRISLPMIALGLLLALAACSGTYAPSQNDWHVYRENQEKFGP